MTEKLVFPYKVYKNYLCPIIELSLYGRNGWITTEAYLDSGAAFSLFSVLEAQRMGIDYLRGRKTFSIVGDGSLIPVYLHTAPAKIGDITIRAVIGFSPRLGVGFNLIGRRDFFTHFDITFSDFSRTVTLVPPK